MVQLSVETEKPTVCVVRDTCPGSLHDKISLQVRPSYLVKQLVEDVSTQFQYKQNEFELVLQAKKGGDIIVLNDLQHQTCSEIGLSFEEDAKNHLIVGPIVSHTRRKAMVDDDDMVLGASASPTAPLPPVAPAPLPALLSSEHLSRYIPQQPVGFVGLVNQAMTCYLNSLLQALYMTPEFRNALYNWQFDGNAETKSIPFQLQKLFLNLQTSTRSAVETTDLTRSFGWDSTEAWQQHDIQELCRVMFDALEQKFKKTQQSDLINRLYEGKMIDYVRCLQCGLEKSREDTFLDIPLPVRPFGSSVAYNSVEEALRAFVQPETLDGNNQYHCEKCNTKCDAYKGLKFSRFPYLLTLHLKRFDFDYQTLHRIKLNDKVTFPEILNLNGFIGGFDNITTESPEEISSASTSRPPEERQPYDDGSTTDSGSALDDECADKEIHINSTDVDYQDLDEGIDMSLSSGDRTNSNPERPGPYKYELFSIMIHSGSASGGHYYAYIKDFKTNRWYCFNDQSVTTITQEDIHKTYGGGPLKGYYSGAYTSSTNAYMLMYRQIDEQRNCVPIDVTEFPPHITELLQKCKEREESDRKNKEMELGMNKVKVFFNHPKKHEMVDTKLYIFNEATLDEATRDAHFKLELDDVVSLDQCRLVSYDRGTETIDRSFEGRSEDQMGEILNSIKPNFQDLLLEIKHPDQKFKVYKPGGINTKIFYVDINTEEMDGPTLVRGNNSQTILEFKQTIVKELQLNVKAETLQLVIEKYSNGPKLLEDGVKLKTESLHGQNKFFVATALDTDPDKPFSICKLHKIIDRFQHVITLHVSLPDTDNETLERMSIPPFDSIENVLPHQAVHSEAHPLGTNSPQQGGDVVDAAVVGGSPIPPLEGENSEDSSLSESDRTLVGDIPQCHLEGRLIEDEKPECWDTDPDEEEPHKTYTTQYFRATTYIENDQKMLKVLIDKRMIVGSLKNELQRYVGVPKEHFRLFKVYSPNQECECARLNESLGTFRDEEHLVVRLGRALRPGEHKGKVFLLKENSAEQTTFLCEWQLSVGVTVAQLKADLLHDKQLDIPLERCRIRKKNWKNPGKVYIDSMKFGDNIPVYSNWEVFLQDLEPPEETKIIETIIITNENHEYNKATALSSKSSNCSQAPQGGSTSNPVVLPPRIWEKVTNTEQVVLFVRRWRPSLMKLERYEEVVLDGMSTQELKEKLSELSSIPIERIEFAKAPNHFPSDMSVLSIQSEMEWAPQTTALDLWPLNVSEDGGVFFYRDKDEPVKDLTAEERKQINSTEGSKLGRYGSSKTTSYSPRREKGLKIYLDNSPKKKDLIAD